MISILPHCAPFFDDWNIPVDSTHNYVGNIYILLFLLMQKIQESYPFQGKNTAKKKKKNLHEKWKQEFWIIQNNFFHKYKIQYVSKLRDTLKNLFSKKQEMVKR